MVSLITALIIQENGAEVVVGQGDNGKYGFEIYSIIREKYRPHLTSQPVYESLKIAKKKGEELLSEINSLDLGKKRKGLSDILGDDTEAVEKVISVSKSK